MIKQRGRSQIVSCGFCGVKEQLLENSKSANTSNFNTALGRFTNRSFQKSIECIRTAEEPLYIRFMRLLSFKDYHIPSLTLPKEFVQF
jgi:hypothetical protein